MAAYNPFRYRGYRYDAETGFYYLQSRYYDPETCRFINADVFASTGQDILGCNMFAYCNNNPVLYIDSLGQAPFPTTVLVCDGGCSYSNNDEEVYSNVNALDPTDTGSKPPDSPNFKPPKGGNRRVKNPNGSGKGWIDKNGNVWVWTPRMHGGEGWTIQYPNGGHHHEYPRGRVRMAIPKIVTSAPSPAQVIFGLTLGVVVVLGNL